MVIPEDRLPDFGSRNSKEAKANGCSKHDPDHFPEVKSFILSEVIPSQYRGFSLGTAPKVGRGRLVDLGGAF